MRDFSQMFGNYKEILNIQASYIKERASIQDETTKFARMSEHNLYNDALLSLQNKTLEKIAEAINQEFTNNLKDDVKEFIVTNPDIAMYLALELGECTDFANADSEQQIREVMLQNASKEQLSCEELEELRLLTSGAALKDYFDGATTPTELKDFGLRKIKALYSTDTEKYLASIKDHQERLAAFNRLKSWNDEKIEFLVSANGICLLTSKYIEPENLDNFSLNQLKSLSRAYSFYGIKQCMKYIYNHDLEAVLLAGAVGMTYMMGLNPLTPIVTWGLSKFTFERPSSIWLLDNLFLPYLTLSNIYSTVSEIGSVGILLTAPALMNTIAVTAISALGAYAITSCLKSDQIDIDTQKSLNINNITDFSERMWNGFTNKISPITNCISQVLDNEHVKGILSIFYRANGGIAM